MTRRALALFALLIMTPSSAALAGPVENAPAHNAPVFRHPSVDAAWQAAQKTKRPMLLFVSSENCTYCVKMLRDTYSNPQIAAALAQSCEPVTVMREDNQALVKKLQVRAFPTTVIVGSDGKEIARVEGYQPPQKFAELMFGPPPQPQATVRPASAVTTTR
ncbi:thiol:disulfide interchange protein precursor [Posidoniimonas polymericola]|uniref:Thiol:disulfide interchange protein n=1 Tax=Posidoniimonas polymericola TaxID=2528002 RepID=A0A5C5YKQ5_9BACT|nr:thioredoxin family protein [Posidoniimonas polymericola]TWT75493.1 thiol:disulfide interchange protein precursor [Posidoniimonas polymericola]